MPGITKTQLANLKTHLYKQMLASLRLLKRTENIDLQLSEHLDNARILYNKGLKIQSLRILERAKELARANQKFNTLVQLFHWKKKLKHCILPEALLIKQKQLAEEALEISGHIDRVTQAF